MGFMALKVRMTWSSNIVQILENFTLRDGRAESWKCIRTVHSPFCRHGLFLMGLIRRTRTTAHEKFSVLCKTLSISLAHTNLSFPQGTYGTQGTRGTPGTHGTYGTSNVARGTPNPTLVPRNNARSSTTPPPPPFAATTAVPSRMSFTTSASIQESWAKRLRDRGFNCCASFVAE